MSLLRGVTAFTGQLEKRSIPYGIIGGLAVFAYGGERTTFDIDFLIDGSFRADIKSFINSLNLQIENENSEVLQLSGDVQIDVIFANRPTAKAMLGRVRTLKSLGFPVVAPEDLIGLKIQAFVGDRSREFVDKGDILTIFRNVSDLNIEKVKEYADTFNVWTEIQDLKNRK